MTTKPKTYLIVGPSWVGDMVMAQSLFIDLKDRQPEAQIDVIAPAWSAALIDRMPQVRRLLSSDFQHGKLSLAERFRLGRQLRAEHYSNAIVLPNSLKSALVPAIAKIPVRTGFLGEQRWGLLNDIRKLDKTKLAMTVQRFLALGRETSAPSCELQAVPKPSLQVNPQLVEQTLNSFDLGSTKPVLVLCPGAEFGSSKKWPAEFYAQVAQHYIEQQWQVWLIGSASDLADCQKINQLTQNQAVILAGKTSMPQAIDLISVASLVVSNDSGLMHVAAALQKPLVAMYGSTDPGHTPPLSSNHAIARLDLECSPCFKRECPLQHHNCMQQLLPERAIELSEQLL